MERRFSRSIALLALILSLPAFGKVHVPFRFAPSEGLTFANRDLEGPDHRDFPSYRIIVTYHHALFSFSRNCRRDGRFLPAAGEECIS